MSQIQALHSIVTNALRGLILEQMGFKPQQFKTYANIKCHHNYYEMNSKYQNVHLL